MEIGFIGDVHGCFAELVEVVENALLRTQRLVFLGDYVNRGVRSRQVVDYLIGLGNRSGVDCTFLRGNHDEAFLDAVVAGNLDRLLRMGGGPTVLSYVGDPDRDVITQLRRSVPGTHLEFLWNLEACFVDEEVFAAHAPNFAVERGKADGRYRIHGHVPQRAGKPAIAENHALIDTGCGTFDGGRLSCLFWPSLSWIQSGRH